MRQTLCMLPLAAALIGLLGGNARAQAGDPIVAARMQTIAARFIQDRQTGGMAAVIEDIRSCYRSAISPQVDFIGVRDCLVLDYTGDETDQHVGRPMTGSMLPFWENTKAADRLRYFGHVAQFKSKYELAQYLRDCYQLVNMNLTQMSNFPH